MEIIWNPFAIEKKSMEIVDELLENAPEFPPDQKAIIKRIVHATGDPDLVNNIVFHPDAINEGIEALQNKSNIFVDVNMLKAGISLNELQKYGGSVVCSIADEYIKQIAKDLNTSRAAAAIRSHSGELNGAIIAIGNAPTALFEVLQMAEEGIKPALIIGTPVGFVGAKESKEMLIEQNNIPFITVTGTRGGSPIAAAVMNAILRLGGNNNA
ncbi:Cobalt-precorrin-8 methylmutase [Candidatus Syntrophocurvum alkaliphilum]|uniref:Cobalt-precorrin-8 methylmutase n=1 Tax=Candidatus Syntrophocurvum alkaliphilum TaxID=2293317 RepID=A0A6I6DLF4_9FIRM|nr:precorrin-8X methylmutase [Candidatus Syntrophocurvum alkaliphilum]QGU00245.1 Cobalt-precorrin-8 methylmutase [Candidatus Syntrophocurvum alkaliphilum]